MEKKRCNTPTEVYSRVVGYFRPVMNWNAGKKEEFKDRKPYAPDFSSLLKEESPKEDAQV